MMNCDLQHEDEMTACDIAKSQVHQTGWQLGEMVDPRTTANAHCCRALG